MRKRRGTLTVCAEPGCHELTDAGRCPAHAREPWQGRTRDHLPRRLSGWEEQRENARILRQYGGVCHVCGATGADEVDHVIPLAAGGVDAPENKRPIHGEPCHRAKTQREARAGYHH